MPTTPRGIWTPGDSDDWDLVTDLAAFAVSVDTAIGAVAATVPLPTRYLGLDAARIALAAPDLRNGIEFQTTDTNLVWTRRSGAWFIAPGQVLGMMEQQGANQGGANVLAGSIVSTPALPVGQRVKITASFSQFNQGVAGTSVVNVNARNNATDVSATVFDKSAPSRVYGPSAGVVQGGRIMTLTTTVAAKVSAAIYTTNAASFVYNADITTLMIESA